MGGGVQIAGFEYLGVCIGVPPLEWYRSPMPNRLGTAPAVMGYFKPDWFRV